MASKIKIIIIIGYNSFLHKKYNYNVYIIDHTTTTSYYIIISYRRGSRRGIRGLKPRPYGLSPSRFFFFFSESAI
jgi:hypothetical protein